MNLSVVDHRPHAWFLLRDGDDYYLDAACGDGPVGFSLLIQLSAAEYEEYHALGRVFTDLLAAKISDGWRSYTDRDVTSSLHAEVSDAVARFRSP